MSDDIPKITDFGLAKFTTGDGSPSEARSGMTIIFPGSFTELTRTEGGLREQQGNC